MLDVRLRVAGAKGICPPKLGQNGGNCVFIHVIFRANEPNNTP